MTQIDIGKMRVKKENHARAVEIFADMLRYQHAHPELFYYSRTRSFFMDAPDAPDEEIWMFIDEYDNREKYWNALITSVDGNPLLLEKLHACFSILTPPASRLAPHETWTEIEEMRISFEHRPLL
ncbi:MAG: hypothetical protein LBI96_00690 [Odoribacteraceae bacterium]|jgi:hypothetical protein|nr:hypothetical protein [Odoribacteraceae bacterium]